MKIYILFKFKDGPTGGGNQVLKSLRNCFLSMHAYEEDIEKADVVLFNSYQYIGDVAKCKFKYPDKIYVHRIDGPIRLYNKLSDKRDHVTNIANQLIADATIFQSEWSKRENYRLGLRENNFEAVIMNAPDPTIFNRDGKISFSTNRRIRLIADSWSTNWKKGFEVYQWLDRNLDYNNYKMKFVGRSPIEFNNIQQVSPLSSKKLANELKKSDIFIFASSVEACSNSLLEALHCGLPVVGTNGSSSPEIIGKAGEIFESPNEIPKLIEKVIDGYKKYQANISNPTLGEVGKRYYDFIKNVYHEIRKGRKETKRFGQVDYRRVIYTIYRWKINEKYSGYLSMIMGSGIVNKSKKSG